MKIFLNLFLLLLFLNVQSQNKSTSTELQPYVDYLEKKSFLTAKDYILSKFQTKDIVIISERDHRDLSQYDIILDVLKDPSFKGNIYTEIGTFNSYKKITSFLLKSDLSEQQEENELLSLYRDLDYRIIWEKYSFYHLLKTIYQINQSRNTEEKILLFPLDLKFDWNDFNCNSQRVQLEENLKTGTINRDLEIGKHFSVIYEFAKKTNPAKTKALVILNTYHGYIRIPTYLPLPNRPDIYSAAQYIYKTYPKITTNVYVNYFTQGFSGGLTNNGLFDAAFQYTETDNIGFDLKNSPYGNSKFDLYDFGNDDYEQVKFDYIFDGMIFYKPVSELNLAIGIPDVYPKEIENQFFERIALIDGITLEKAIKENKDYLETINNLKHFELSNEKKEKIKKQIDFWLK